MKDKNTIYRYLALGDSYTIGEGVAERESFPHQLLDFLRGEVDFFPPTIIAKTGWTTAELMQGIDTAELPCSKFDWVTLLIGVNNQYRNQSVDQYAGEFEQLLERAIQFADNKPQRVVVLSIPDWGVTPFAREGGRDLALIAEEIDRFNQVNLDISCQKKVHYLDITSRYREVGGLEGYFVEDRLHPSAKIYSHWAERIGELVVAEKEAERALPVPFFIPDNQNTTDIFYAQKVASLNPRSLITCEESMPIYRVAERMAQEKTSCMFIMNEKGEVSGYVTDITLRDQVIAKRISGERPVVEVMERKLVAIDREAFIYEALLLMFQTHTRYILLTSGNEYVGFISRNKLLSEQSQSSLVFIQSVKQATSLEELTTKWEQVPGIVQKLLERGIKSEIVNQVITAVSDTIVLRVIDQVIHDVGPPPSKFVFITLGSEGRKEQTLKTDQDNAIIYEDKANEQRELVREYFLKFADQVSEALNTIGFSFCKGDFMAKNPKWTHSLSHWKRNYDEWMMASTQETVMKYSTFFDNRAVYGDVGILEELHEHMELQLQAPLARFFLNMAQNSFQYEPPLTFFKGIRTFNVGEKKVFDIKRAMTPIVDLTRVFALKYRIFETNTGERLRILAEKGHFTSQEYQEIRHAYYYLMALRLESQARQIADEKVAPQNVIFLEKLTKVERVALVEVFKVIKDFQLKVKIQFTNSLF